MTDIQSAYARNFVYVAAPDDSSWMSGMFQRIDIKFNNKEN